MELLGNKVRRCIYVYEFCDNSAYIGLTYNIKNRHERHMKKENSPVFKNINKGLSYNLKQLTDYVNIELAQNLEDYYVKEYKKNNWVILNNRKTGGLGGNILKWTKEKCKEEASKYTSRKDFRQKSSSAYRSAKKMLILDEICLHMIKK